MAKREIVFFVFHLLFIGACSGQEYTGKNIIGTVWIKEGDFCSDSLHFYSDGKYQEYYCEFEQHMNGNFLVNGDTVTLVEYQLSSEVIADNPKLAPRYIVKYLFQKNNLLEKIYYKDLMTEYEEIGLESDWKYIKIE